MTLTLCASPPFRMHVPFKQAYDALLAIRAERAVHAAASVEARDPTLPWSSICFVAPRTFSISPGQTMKPRFQMNAVTVGWLLFLPRRSLHLPATLLQPLLSRASTFRGASPQKANSPQSEPMSRARRSLGPSPRHALAHLTAPWPLLAATA